MLCPHATGVVRRSKKMKRNLILIFILLLTLFYSCQNGTESENLIGDKTSTDITDDTKKENEKANIGSAYIMNGSIYNNNWYVPNVSNDTQYFSFTNSKIYYRFSYNKNSTFSGIGSSKTGTLTFLDNNLSRFEYKWDDGISGSEKTDSILILDKDILVVNNGLDCSNEIAKTHICYKDLSAYTNDVPFMGFGKTAQNSYSEWFIFTPSGNCYKRYLNFQTNELLIVSGIWEKNDEQTYKIFWSKNNKSKYDILRGTKLYQNASENISSVPVNLYVTRY